MHHPPSINVSTSMYTEPGRTGTMLRLGRARRCGRPAILMLCRLTYNIRSSRRAYVMPFRALSMLACTKRLEYKLKLKYCNDKGTLLGNSCVSIAHKLAFGSSNVHTNI